MFGHWLEAKIDKLEDLFPIKDKAFRFGKFERGDWRPVWELCKEIQEDFRSVRDFPSAAERQKVWEKFCSLRARASELADYEKEAFSDQSKELRNDLFYRLKGVGWTPFDDIMFFFDPTTVEEIKQMGSILHEVGQQLKEFKSHMTGAHKSEVFERMQEKRSQLDHFWEKRKAAQEVRNREFERKREAFRSRVLGNMQKNRESLCKAEAAADRCRDRISELNDKMNSATSASYADRVSGWLSEELDRFADIQASIERIRGWIEDDESKLG